MSLDSPGSRNGSPRGEVHGGRRLDLAKNYALRRAALDLVAESGYDRLTVEAVAQRVGASKATIYRRWSGKAELVVDALSREKFRLVPPDTGTLRGDLRAVARHMSSRPGLRDAQVMRGLVAALPHDDELRDVFHRELMVSHLAMLTRLFDRAVARGEIRPLANTALVVSLLPSMALHQLAFAGVVPSRRFIESVIDEVVLPLVGLSAVESDTVAVLSQ